MGIMDMVNAAKGFALTAEQKETIKNVVKEASGNKEMVVSELNKRGISISADQVDAVLAMVEGL